MLKLQIEDIKKENRKYFKENLLKVTDKLNVYFTLDKAIIEVTEPYIATEESIVEKSKIKKAINSFVADFRVYQFNQ